MKQVILACVAILVASCGNGLASDACRFEPDRCNGGFGGFCDDDRDCHPDLDCCKDDKNCGNGMCTADCGNDEDCPGGMACEHGMCFYACDSNDDCADGMSCEHDNTVCEWD